MSTLRVLVVEPDEEDVGQLLAAAIRAGNVPRVQDLLCRQAAPLGFSLLQAACCRQRDVLEVLLDAVTSTPAPAQPPGGSTSADALGRTPLVFAAGNGDYGAVQLLLSRGADVNACDLDGMTPVAYAALAGHRGCMELLLDAGAELDSRAGDGSSPLLLAAEEGHRHCVEALLRRGADPSAADASGVTPLLAALAGGHKRTAEVLLDAGAKAEGRADGRTALHWAAHYGMARVLARVLETAAAANVDVEDSEGEVPLLLAARRGHKGCVEVLLQHGAAIDKPNRGGVTPLIAAALFGHDGTVASLLARGAAMAATDATHKRTPLHWAAVADAAAAAEALLQSGADGRATDGDGATAMDLAVEYDSQAVVQLFVSWGGSS